MDKYIITEEEQEKIKLYTVRSMPDNPTERGMPPGTIKKFFYKFLEPLFQTLNKHLGEIESGMQDAVSEHDTDNASHDFLLRMISDLQTQIMEQGSTITEHYSDVEHTILELNEKINTDISTHNNSQSTHRDIRTEVTAAKNKAISAYNLASGKAKVYPVRNAETMVSLLSDEINVGDKFILQEVKTPDFTLFAKNYDLSEDDTDIIDISEANIRIYNFILGKNYFYNGYLLVPSESGIDTSMFAKSSDFGHLESLLEELYDQFDTYRNETDDSISNCEVKKKYIRATSETITLKNDTEYILGLRTSIIINLPTSIESDFECIVNFSSGTEATSFDTPNEIIFTQDDCLDGKLYPVSDRLYEINIKNVGGVLVAKVGACDYAIL